MNQNEDLYEILQVHHAAEPEVIEAAYRRLLHKYHPDVNKTPEAHEITVRLNKAYEVLRDPAKRADYDRQRSSQTEYNRRRQERQAEQERQSRAERQRREREAQAERERRTREEHERREREAQAERERQEYLEWERQAQAHARAEQEWVHREAYNYTGHNFAGSAAIFEQVKAIRKKANRSWRNIRQGVRALQDKSHEPFSTPKVEASSKAVVRRVIRETGITFVQLEDLLDEHGLGY